MQWAEAKNNGIRLVTESYAVDIYNPESFHMDSFKLTCKKATSIDIHTLKNFDEKKRKYTIESTKHFTPVKNEDAIHQ